MFYLKKYWYIVLIVLVVVVLIVFSNKNTDETDLITDLNLQQEESTVLDETEETIKIDIKGAVKNPGVYELDTNSRVSDAIEISGGLTKEADTSVINLSKNLTDEMVIIIYTKSEISEMLKGSTSVKYIEKECICPKLENDACIDTVIDNKPSDANDSNSSNGKVSLNKATIDELMQLSGIGEVKAKAIIAYREKNGGFKTIEELMEVNGIGETTFNKIKDQLTL